MSKWWTCRIIQDASHPGAVLQDAPPPRVLQQRVPAGQVKGRQEQGHPAVPGGKGHRSGGAAGQHEIEN